MPGREVVKKGGLRFYRKTDSGCVSVWGSEGFIDEIYTHDPMDKVVNDYLNSSRRRTHTEKAAKRNRPKQLPWLIRYILYSLGFSDDE